MEILKKVLTFCKRYWIIILTTIAGLFINMAAYNNGKAAGYAAGYEKCVKDRPTYGQVQTVNEYHEVEFKHGGIMIQLWKLKLKIGN